MSDGSLTTLNLRFWPVHLKDKLLYGRSVLKLLRDMFHEFQK